MYMVVCYMYATTAKTEGLFLIPLGYLMHACLTQLVHYICMSCSAVRGPLNRQTPVKLWQLKLHFCGEAPCMHAPSWRLIDPGCHNITHACNILRQQMKLKQPVNF